MSNFYSTCRSLDEVMQLHDLLKSGNITPITQKSNTTQTQWRGTHRFVFLPQTVKLKHLSPKKTVPFKIVPSQVWGVIHRTGLFVFWRDLIFFINVIYWCCEQHIKIQLTFAVLFKGFICHTNKTDVLLNAVWSLWRLMQQKEMDKMSNFTKAYHMLGG